MGKITPVVAPIRLNAKFCFRRSKRVPRPPGVDDISIPAPKSHDETQISLTFEDDQNQTDISQSDKSLLPLVFKDVGQRYTVDDANGDLANNAGLDDLCGNPFCKGKEKEEGYDDEKLDNYN